MEFRYLGRSGLKVSAISYGNWITHGSQVEEDAANACVKRALDLGITTYDTADVYAGTKAEAVLGRALDGVKRESIEVFTKVFWPTGKGVNNRGLSRKHIMHSIDASLSRLKMDYVDLYQAHRFDVETPLEETMLAFSDIVRQGKALYIGVSEWSADEITRGAKLAREMNVPFISNQPQYSMLWRVIEEEVVPLWRKVLNELRIPIFIMVMVCLFFNKKFISENILISRISSTTSRLALVGSCMNGTKVEEPRITTCVKER